MGAVAIYARVSTARQREEETIASQTAALLAHAEQQGLEVPPEWVFEDEGYSGATLVRPALERLRDLAAQVGVDVVLCYSPDRLARNYAYQVLLIEEFARAGTEVRFVYGPRADTPEDTLLVQFQGMIAEYERAQIAERTRRGRVHRARAGSVSVLGGAPYGYRYVRRTDDADARYEVVPQQAAVVRSVFHRYVNDGCSIADLTRWLAEQGVPTATGKTRWDRTTVWGMLRNPAYAGRAAFCKTARGGRTAVTRTARLQGEAASRYAARCSRPQEEWIEIPVPAIVSEETFALAARRLEDNRRFAARNTKEPSLLQGLVACERCGYACYRARSCPRGGHTYFYYRCIGAEGWRHEHGPVCDLRPVRADELEALVWTHVTNLLADPALIAAELDRRLAEVRSTNPATAQRSRLELELTRTTAAITRLLEAYQEGLVALEELRIRMPDLRKRQASLRVERDVLDAQLLDQESYLALAENLESFLARLKEKAESASIEERQRVLRLIVKDVLVGPQRVVIRHSIPTPSGGPPTPGYLLRRGSLQGVVHLSSETSSRVVGSISMSATANP